jgi:hypothetical protein
MFLTHRPFAPMRRSHVVLNSKRVAVTASLSTIATLCACGGGPKPGNPLSTNGGAFAIAAKLPAATEGSSYTGRVTASGGTSPYKYTMSSGQMPQGVNLDQTTGNVAGTPTSAGNFKFGVTASDATGASAQQSMQIVVAQGSAPAPPTQPPPSSPTPPSTPASPSSPPSGNTFSNLQNAGGWGQYGQGPPNFVDCSPSPCDGIEFSMTQNQSSPSLSGQSAVFWVGGTTPYSDALFNNHLIGPYSSQGLPDTDGSVTSSLSTFTYDADFYGDNLGLAEALEFDINQFFNNMGFIFGHQCRVANGNEWDVWDNSQGKWVPTGVPCYPKSGQWNHVTLKVQRTSDNHETYQSITLNGQTTNLNWTLDKGSSPGWSGVTVNFQIDGDYKQDPYKVYLDNLTLRYE